MHAYVSPSKQPMADEAGHHQSCKKGKTSNIQVVDLNWMDSLDFLGCFPT
jgi:hypothetical protein